MFRIFADKNKYNYWQMTFNRSVDFAIWVLERDGLHVPPFTAYPSLLGNNLLTDAGLTPAGWQDWFGAVLNAAQTRSYSFTAIANPWQFYQADSRTREVLKTLWQFYLPVSNVRKSATNEFTNRLFAQQNVPVLMRVEKTASESLPLQIFLTGYPAFLTHVPDPGRIILAPAGGHIQADDLKKILHHAASSPSTV
jgi:hypothetical protein